MTLTDRLNGKSFGMRWVISAIIVWPRLAVRFALIGALSVLWMVNAPHVISLVWSSAMQASSTPNKERTPEKHQCDDFDDVRARISELTQSPEQ